MAQKQDMLSQLSKAFLEVRGVATTVYERDGYTCVQYHHTVVVRFNAKEIHLDTGGWATTTTKRRMNQASLQFNLGFDVWQKDWQWYVGYHDEKLPFDREITIKRCQCKACPLQ